MRKSKREKAFQAVALTQWRVAARQLSTAHFVSRKMAELDAASALLADTSAISHRRLGRSATCRRLEPAAKRSTARPERMQWVGNK
jgi:hypothetical protein